MKLPTRSEFRFWRSPRRGTANPERMDNAFWEWCVRTRESAYGANERFQGPNAITKGPCWCFERMGQAQVVLPDGREVYIGGEHEDHYDPDFFIYNDVVIVDGDQISIYGYPVSVFPPTDFHTATLVGDDILLIGNLSYPDHRRVGATQVLRLNTQTLEISTQPTTGENPGWLFDHSASLSESGDILCVTGGQRVSEQISENFHDYQLCLRTFDWCVSVRRNWKAWLLERADKQANNLWRIRQAAWEQRHGFSTRDHLAQQFEDLPEDVLAEMMPRVAQSQVQDVSRLYGSLFDGTSASQDDDHVGRFVLVVDGVRVRIDEDMYGVTVTVEGDLSDGTVATILSQLEQRLGALEQTRYVSAPVPA